MAGRPARTALLLAAVALASCLVVAAAVCLDTISESITRVVGRVTGLADLRISHIHHQPFDAAVVEIARTWPQVKTLAATYDMGITLKNERNKRASIVNAKGIDPVAWPQINPTTLINGRLPEQPGEIALGEPTRDELKARVGDEIAALSLGKRIPLRVVGVFERPRLDILQQALVFVTRDQVEALADKTGVVAEIQLQLHDSSQVDQVQSAYQQSLPEGVRFQTAVGAAAQAARAVRTARLMLLLLTSVVYLASSFIILTSLGISVIERLGELSILRCIGASRGQIAAAQLLAGALLGLTGGAIGLLPGIAAAWWFYHHFSDAFIAGFHIAPLSIAGALLASTFAGLVGGAYPALLAATRQPLEGLTARAAAPRLSTLLATTGIGLSFIALPLLLHATPLDVQLAVRIHLALSLLMIFIGFFLLTAPLALLVGYIIAPILALLLRIPADLLRRQFTATPYRNGFAGGALMVGMAMLVAVWTIGPGLLGGWMDGVKMPDGFVHSFFSLSDSKWRALQKIEGVTDLCPVTAFPVTADNASFGIKGVSPPATLFVSCDIPAFLRMTDLEWIEGDPATAAQRASLGRALIVSREYRVAHGIGVGSTLTLNGQKGPVIFDVVGVVASKGLDIATHSFGIQSAYEQAALSSVFGTREDADKYFNVESINLVLLKFDPAVSDGRIMARIRNNVPGVIVGSSRRIIRNIKEATDRLLAAMSVLALAVLSITCLGVTNLIAAMLAAQRFELGVLRAVGASRGMLARSVLAQALMLAIIGSIAGTALGFELAWIDHLFVRKLLGLLYTPHLPVKVVGWGAMALAGGALLAAVPPLISLMRQRVREMIAAG